MNTYLLGLRGAIANGTEPTFDAQPMQSGNHLRWGFAPELGFPPYGFQLCRKVAGQGERHITPPQHIWRTGSVVGTQSSTATVQQTGKTSHTATTQGVQSSSSSVQGSEESGKSGKQAPQSTGNPGSPFHSHAHTPTYSHGHTPLPWQPATYEWHARLPETCHQLSIDGTASEEVEEVILETYVHVSASKVVITGRHCAKVEQHRFSATVRASAITAVAQPVCP